MLRFGQPIIVRYHARAWLIQAARPSPTLSSCVVDWHASDTQAGSPGFRTGLSPLGPRVTVQFYASGFVGQLAGRPQRRSASRRPR
jgi:hypothetical protein